MKRPFASSWRHLLPALLVAAALMTLCSALPATAQDVDLKDSRYVTSTFESPFVKVAEQLKPSVVFISAVREREIRSRMPWFFENHPFFERRQQPESEPRVQEVPSSGSGFLIDEDGYLITNNHVVQDAKDIKVKLASGDEYEAEVVGMDPETDLALLKIDSDHVDPSMVAPLGDSDAIQIGDWAIAMGNPLGLDWTLTVGVISAKGRSNLNISGGGPIFQDFIQTDASINFGNSGGPLTNIHGEVIGINAAVNASADGIGFAIPINLAKDVVAQLKDTGTIRRGYLGMVPRPLTDLLREALGVDDDVDGVFVEAVEPKTPAEEGGLMESDIITEVDDRSVDDVNDFRFRIARHAPGDKMTLTVLRDGDEKTLKFTLGDRSDFLDLAQAPDATPQRDWMGLEVAALSDPVVRRNLNTDLEEGVVVVGLSEDSPARGVLRPGDVIVEVGQQEVTNLSDWKKVTAELEDEDKAVLVKYHPQGQPSTRYTALKQDD